MKGLKNRALLILLVWNISQFALQANEITHFTASQGLSGTDITAICENENYIWVATNDGLCRFDGKVFKVFKKENGSANSISENNIETLLFDSNGLLWIGFKTGGVDVYDPKKGTFTHISKLVSHYPQRVISLFEDSNKTMWLGSWEEGLFELTPIHRGKFNYEVHVHLEGFIVSSIIEKPKKQIWAGTYDGLYRYNQNKWLSINKQLVVSQLIDNKDKSSFLCSTWNEGVFKVNCCSKSPHNISLEPICAKDDQVYRIFPFADYNSMIVGTWGNGLKLYNYKDKTMSEFDKHFKAPVILSLLKDSYNNFWVGTYGNGLFQITTANRGISSFSPINSKGYASAYTIKALGENKIILGTEGEGLYSCDLLHTALKKQINSNEKGGQSNFILSIYKDNNLVIIGHDDIGVYLLSSLNKQTSKLSYSVFKSDKRFAKVTSIFKGNDNRIWFGTKQNGLISAYYNEDTKKLEKFTFYNSLVKGQITGFAQHDDQRLWISSHSGLYLFNTTTNSLDKNQKLRMSEMIYSMARDVKNECIWLGTSVGLRKINYHYGNKQETPFPTLLPQGAINNLLIDSYNNLWFSVGSRVFCLIDKTNKLKEINLGEFGNQLFLSSTTAYIKGKNCVILGGEKSLVIIDPAISLNQPDDAKIIFTELQIDHSRVNVGNKVYGRVVLKQQTEYVKKIEFSYRCKWVSLSLTQVGWNNYKNHYQYRIDGFSQSWQFLDLEKPIIFSQLQPGNYKLIIRKFEASANEKPIWELSINVIPPWWQTTWFYGLLTLFLLIIITITIYLIINHYEKKQSTRMIEIEKKKKEEILLEKESFFAGLSHDLLTPFSLIIAPAGDLLKAVELNPENMEKVQIINKNASYLSDIFKTILDFKRVESIDIRVDEKKIELISFIKLIVDSFGYMARSKKIDFQFVTNTEILTVLIDVVKFERILFNLLSNAFKFTKENGCILFSLEYKNDFLYIQLKDSGIGIESDKLNLVFEKFYQNTQVNKPQGFGLGLYIVRKFITLLNGKIEIQSQENVGTLVLIELPVQVAEPDTPQYSTCLNTSQIQDEDVSILLVEDNEDMKDYLKKLLSKHFAVATASNGEEAFDFIQNNLPEIVISDIMMPKMDGLTLCKKIKETPLYSDVFVVLLSAKSSPEDELKGFKVGADFYVAKPFDGERFTKQIINIYATRIHRRKQILKSMFNQKNDSDHHTAKDDFLSKAIIIIEKHIMDENFKIDKFAAEMNVSKTVLHRKFNMLIGETPNVFIRHVKLHKAADLLINSNLNVAEIAYLTGFNQSHYFIKCFKEVYNDTPGNFRQQKSKSVNTDI